MTFVMGVSIAPLSMLVTEDNTICAWDSITHTVDVIDLYVGTFSAGRRLKSSADVEVKCGSSLLIR